MPVDVSEKDVSGTCIPGERIKRALGEMPGRMVAIFDACHSGAASGVDKAQGTELGRGLADDLVRDLVTEEYGIIVMSSSTGRELSIESKEVKHGFYTLALLEGLNGQADLNRDGVIYLNELDAYTARRVRLLSQGLQNPVIAKPTFVRWFPVAKK